MSIRQYYAAMAMQGDWADGGFENMTDGNLYTRARLYFRMADAMIRAGKEQGE